MTQPFVGEIRMFGGGFAPTQWALCNGQLLPISQYQILFTLLGTTYGGDGTTSFALPDLRGRIPVGQGNGPSLTPRVLGQNAGTETVLLLTANLPVHSHPLNATGSPGTQGTINSSVVPAKSTGSANVALYVTTGTPPPVQENMQANTSGMTGGNQPHDNIMPSQCVSFIIALFGIFPSQN